MSDTLLEILTILEKLIKGNSINNSDNQLRTSVHNKFKQYEVWKDLLLQVVYT